MLFAFLVSFFSFAHANWGGKLYFSELILVVYLLFSVGKFRLLSEPLPNKVLKLGILWLIAQIVTDLIRQSPPENFLRGWAAITFFLLDFCALYIMVRQRAGVVRMLVLGSALGGIFSVVVLPTEYSQIEPWKFGYGTPITMLALLYLSIGNKHRAKSGLLLLIVLGLLGIYLNARSLGGMTILTAAILYLVHQPGFRSYSTRRQNPIKLAGMALGGMLAAFSILSIYQWSAESGYLPEEVTRKYEMTKSSSLGVLGLILGGRIEFVASTQAVMDSPFWGHGSWAEDRKYSSLLLDADIVLGTDRDVAQIESEYGRTNLIPTHSTIMQAWVWAGMLGAIFWLFIFQFIVRNMIASFTISHALQPLIIFVGISSLWNLWFSPFGADARISWAVVLMIIFVAGSLHEASKAVGMAKKERVAR